MKPSSRKEIIYSAFKDIAGAPGIALLITLFSLGVLYYENNFSFLETLLSTLLIYAIPGQILFSDQWALNAPALNIILSVAILNLRQVPMAAILVPMLQNSYERSKKKTRPIKHYLLAMHFVAVTGWSNFIDRHRNYPKKFWFLYYMTSNLYLMIIAIVGTVLGYLLAPSFPPILYGALLIANPLYFIGVIVISTMKNPKLLMSVSLGAGLTYPITQLSFTWGILLAGFLGGSLTFVFYDYFYPKIKRNHE